MKLAVADRLALFADPVFLNPTEYSGEPILFAGYFFGFQLYCDFAGYSCIAIGVSRLFGIELMKNFDTPYFSSSITEFWRRWHISLSGWFRDYVYIPLGGNQVSLPRTIFNLFAVFFLSGFWHGASWNFGIWGIFHWVLVSINLILNKIFTKPIIVSNSPYIKWTKKIIMSIIIFHLVTISWYFFRAKNLKTAVFMIQNIFRETHYPENTLLVFMHLKAGIISILLLLFFEISRNNSEYIRSKLSSNSYKYLVYLFYASLLVLIFLMGVFHGSTFIYFQF